MDETGGKEGGSLDYWIRLWAEYIELAGYGYPVGESSAEDVGEGEEGF